MKNVTENSKSRRPNRNTALAGSAWLLFVCALIVGCGTPQHQTESQVAPVAQAAESTPVPPSSKPDAKPIPVPQTPVPEAKPISVPQAPAPGPKTPAPKPQAIPTTNLKTDEHVLLFPTNAVYDKSSQRWKLNIHGWVYEPETDSVWRVGLIKSLALFVGVKKNTADEQRFTQRTAMFLVDNERNKNIVLSTVTNTPTQHFSAPTTGANGHFEFDASLSQGQSQCSKWLTLNVRTNGGDHRNLKGQIQCLSHNGISVISDIDDTIKDSNVLDKKKLLKKTFLKEFSSVKGMSTLYQHWSQLGYQFHYVSSSPWQLYPVLSDFIDTKSFPRGSMHLKLIRVKDKSIFNLMATPEEGKMPTITNLLGTYPQRRFILVGDSGERDADIYATVAKKYPGRIIKIYIHNVTDDKARIEKIFAGLPTKQWVVFTNTSEILNQHALLNPGK